MDFKKLRTFRAAARLLNFSEASDQLGYVQSAVTNQIKMLEDELQTELFTRNGRGVSLTPAGAKLLEYADKLFLLRDEAKSAVTGVETHQEQLNIAGYETILTYRLPKIIHTFRQQQPQVNISIKPVSVRLLKSQVSNGDIDIAFVLEQTSDIAGLGQLTLPSEEVILIASPENRLTAQRSVNATDLAGETILLTEQGCNYRNKFERALIKGGAYNGHSVEFVSIEAIKSCVKMGTGIAAVSKISVERELESGELSQLNWAGDDLSVAVTAIWKKKPTESELVKEFLTLCSRQQTTARRKRQ